MKKQITVPSVDEMEDETFIKHLEKRHPEVEATGMKFTGDPGSPARTMREPESWRGLHRAQHLMYPHRYDHEHLGED